LSLPGGGFQPFGAPRPAWSAGSVGRRGRADSAESSTAHREYSGKFHVMRSTAGALLCISGLVFASRSALRNQGKEVTIHYECPLYSCKFGGGAWEEDVTWRLPANMVWASLPFRAAGS